MLQPKIMTLIIIFGGRGLGHFLHGLLWYVSFQNGRIQDVRGVNIHLAMILALKW